MPSAQQKEAHEVAGHLDYAPRCESCDAGKAGERPHRLACAVTMRTPTVIADYSFLTIVDGVESGLKLLCARDRRTGSVFANSCVCKESSDKYAVAAMATWLERPGYKKVIVMCDDENAINDLLRSVKLKANAR